MSTTAVNTLTNNSAIVSANQQFDQFRAQDLTALGRALQSGNLSLAQAAFNAASSLQSTFGTGPFPRLVGATSAFNAVGQALQNGDLAGARAAGKQLIADGEKALKAIRDEVPPDVILEVTPPTAGGAIAAGESLASSSIASLLNQGSGSSSTSDEGGGGASSSGVQGVSLEA